MPGPWCRGFLVSLLLGSIWPSFTHLKQMNGCDSFLAPVLIFSALAPPLACCELWGLCPFLGGVGS